MNWGKIFGGETAWEECEGECFCVFEERCPIILSFVVIPKGGNCKLEGIGAAGTVCTVFDLAGDIHASVCEINL